MSFDEKDIKTFETLKNVPIYPRCTYAIAYTQPYELDEPRVNSKFLATYNRWFILQGYTLIKNGVKENLKNINFRYEYFADLNWQNGFYLQKQGFDFGVDFGQIGVLTGEYYVNELKTKKKKTFQCLWLRAHLLFCDKSTYGWFRANDLLPDIDIKLPEKTKETPAKKSWLSLLAAGITLYNLGK